MSYGVFDLHAHVVFDEALGRAGSYGPRHGHDEEGREFFQVGSYTMKLIPYSTSLFMNVDTRLHGGHRAHGQGHRLRRPVISSGDVASRIVLAPGGWTISGR